MDNTTYKKITLVICSNRIEKLENYILPSVNLISLKYQVLIILDKKINNVNSLFLNKLTDYKNVKLIKSTESGLSNLRNNALDECNTEFIIFLDDDVSFDNNTIECIENALIEGNNVVGLKLVPPNKNYVNRWFFTENQYHYIGLHSSLNNNSIWGACMAFNMKMIKKLNIRFQSHLDRHENNLLSGGDTTFINNLKRNNAKDLLLNDKTIIHNVDINRLTFFIFCKRVFWQGITESVRYNIKKGLIKEFKRNFQVINILTIPIGIMWFSVFVFGEIFGFLNCKKYL